MFTETVTISLERYEQLKRFESVENTRMVAVVQELDQTILKMLRASSRHDLEKLGQYAFDLCKKLKRHEER